MIQTYISYGQKEFKIGNNDKALYWYKEALNINPKSEMVLNVMLSHGFLEFRNGNNDKALFWYDRVITNEYDFDTSKNKNLMNTTFAEDVFLVGLTFNLKACATNGRDWFSKITAAKLLNQIESKHPKFKEARAMTSELQKNRLSCL